MLMWQLRKLRNLCKNDFIGVRAYTPGMPIKSRIPGMVLGKKKTIKIATHAVSKPVNYQVSISTNPRPKGLERTFSNHV